jgi:hypothetical protein
MEMEEHEEEEGISFHGPNKHESIMACSSDDGIERKNPLVTLEEVRSR